MNKEIIKLEDFINDCKLHIKYFNEFLENDDLCIAFMDIDEGRLKIPDSFPYTFIEGYEWKGDGSGYWYTYIFQRKSDLKYFEYTIYECRIQDDYLREVEKVIEQKTTWK